MITTQPTTCEIVVSILKDIASEANESAREKLTSLIHMNPDWEVNEDTLYLVFSAALAKKLNLEKKEESNIYLQNHSVSQIELFNLLATQFPLASLPGKLANHVLCNYIKPFTEIALLEIGIGTGRQTVLLLEELQSRRTLPKRLTVYAIEPNQENLNLAEENLQQAARQYGVEIIFHAFPTVIEDLDASSWEKINTCSDPLFVNAAFALHHIGGTDQETRKSILQKICQCTPVVFVLCEPNSDHHTADFELRFANCWNHFKHIFHLIDQLHISKEEQTALKLFFSREIEDIIGNSEENRYERHENLSSWSHQLREVGFSLHTEIDLPEQHEPLLTIVKETDTLGIKFEDEILVGTIIAIPKEKIKENA